MSWSGVKNQVNKADIEAWCDEMGIKHYTINSKGEIDVDGGVWLGNKEFKELPYKFGAVKYDFEINKNANLISLKNCPDYVGGYFSCRKCTSLDSLEGCPKRVDEYFWCGECKIDFTENYVRSLCKKIGCGVKLSEK